MTPKEAADLVIAFSRRVGDPGMRQRAATRAALKGQALLVPETPADTGLMRHAWHVKATADGAELRNDAPYAAVMERGSTAHWPPWEPIVRWTARKLQVSLAGADLSHYGQIRGVVGDRIDEVERMAYGVCKKIAERGQAPLFFVRRNLGKLGRIYVEEVLLELSPGGSA